MGSALTVAAMVVIAVALPAALGYLLPSWRIAAGVAAAAVVLISFAPLGADQPAPWQDGFPGDGDWRVVAFPVWLLLALACARLGSRLSKV